MVQILPFAEQLNAFDTIGSLSTVYGQPFAPIAKYGYGKFADSLVGKNTPANGSLNPNLIDDETIDRLKLSWAACPGRATGGVNERRAQCTYRANGGSQTLLDDGPMKHASATDGRGFALDAITDGLSMTYLVWERNDGSQLYVTSPSQSYNRTPFYCGKTLSVGLYRCGSRRTACLDRAVSACGVGQHCSILRTESELRPPGRRVWCPDGRRRGAI